MHSLCSGMRAGQLSLDQALCPVGDAARIITEATEPFRIVHVNEVWCKVCGVDAEESLGKTCTTLQGRGTCKETLTMLRQALMLGRPLSVQLLHYTTLGRPFISTLQVTPLADASGSTSHFLGLVTAHFLDGGGPVPPSVQLLAEPAPTPAPPGPAASELEPEEQSSAGSSAAGNDYSSVRYPDHHSTCSGEQPEERDRDGAGSSAGESAAGAGPSSGGGAGPGGGRVPPFLTKLGEILSLEPNEMVALDPENAGFHIADAARFAREVLPRYFKHNQLGSFSQQLNTYGFRRKLTAPDNTLTFQHERYEGEPDAFLLWVRAGGAHVQAKKERGSTPGEGASPPAALLQGLHRVDVGIRGLGLRFEQAKSEHGMTLGAVLDKLVRQGRLSSEQAQKVATLRPPAEDGGVAAELSGALHDPPGGGWSGLHAMRSVSADELQAQLDALEAGLPPLALMAGAALGGLRWATLGGLGMQRAPSDLRADEALALFADVTTLSPGLHPSPALHSLLSGGRSSSSQSDDTEFAMEPAALEPQTTPLFLGLSPPGPTPHGAHHESGAAATATERVPPYPVSHSRPSPAPAAAADVEVHKAGDVLVPFRLWSRDDTEGGAGPPPKRHCATSASETHASAPREKTRECLGLTQ